MPPLRQNPTFYGVQVFVQMISTGRLLKSDSVWVNCREEARHFEDSAAAINYCIAHGIEGARFLLSFGDPELDIYVDAFGAEKRWVAAQSQMG